MRREVALTLSVQTLVQVLVALGALGGWWMLRERDAQHDHDRIGVLEIHDKDIDKRSVAYDVRMDNAEKIDSHLLIVANQIARKVGIRDADLPPMPTLEQVPRVSPSGLQDSPPWNLAIDTAISRANLPYSAVP